MHKISITILPQCYRPDADLDKIYGELRAAGIDIAGEVLTAEECEAAIARLLEGGAVNG